MKYDRAVASAVAVIIVASAAAWRVWAQGPVSVVGPAAQWQYPGADVRGAVNEDRSSAFPLQGVQSRTPDSIEKVYAFYQKKVDPRYTDNESNGWQKGLQIASLTVLFPSGGQSSGYLQIPRHEADSALLIVHQPRQTMTVELSRDPQDRSMTDILLVADSH